MKINTNLIVVLLLFSAGVSLAQTRTDDSLSAEIDAQIWRPFIQAFNHYDADSFNRLHTTDVLRASPGGIVQGDAYFQQNHAGFQKNREAGNTRRIAFTFEYRIQQPEIAYEVGYYRLISTRQGEEKTFYGQFHVVLKKIGGAWKIAQDWDAGKFGDHTIGEADFLQHAGKGLYE